MPPRDPSLRLVPSAVAACDAARASDAGREIAVDLADVRFGFDRRSHALRDVTCRIPEGATCAVLGPNGSGKSTLLELVAGLRVPTHGTVLVFGERATGNGRTRRRDTALVSARTHPPGGFRIASLLRHVAPWHPRWDPALAEALLAHFALAGRQRIDTLSLGSRMKVQLLCALAARPRLLLLDEPFAGLDVTTKEALLQGLLLPDDAEGRTVLVASHDIAELELLVDHLVLLDGGHLRLEGALDALRASAPRATSLRGLYRRHTQATPHVQESAA